MPLSDYALTTPDEVRTYKGAEGATEDPRLESAINAASIFIESQTHRRFITRGAATEYHSVYRERHTITLAYSPIITLTSVHESTSSPRAYNAASLLTSGTDYVSISEPTGAYVRRLSSSELYPWAKGYRCIQVIYSYGYANTAALPLDLKHLAMKLAWALYKESDRGWDGITSVTDAQGSVTRIGRLMTADMKAILDSYTQILFERTWEAA